MSILRYTSMNALHTAVDALEVHRPNGLPLKAQDIGSTLKVGGSVLLAAGGTVFSAFKAYRRVPEGFVAIRTFNGKARNKHGQPAHELLQPGGNVMMPFFHDIELINIQHQATLIDTKTDVQTVRGFEQYDLGAIATWGVIADRSDKTKRPQIAFDDAFNFFYGIDSMQDLEARVAAEATGYLLECVGELDEAERSAGILSSYANANIEATDALRPYGVRLYGITVSHFARAGIVQFGGAQNGVVIQPQAIEA